MSSFDEPQPTISAKKGGKARSYSDKTLKLLFALCGNKCAHPDCSQPIIQAATLNSPDLVVGQICHIYAHSGKGPRGNAEMTERRLREADNLILFCPTHHVIIDGQHETYPASLLKQWKEQHERPYREKLSEKLTDIGFAELEIAAKALLAPSAVANGDYQTIPPAEKIEKNRLGATSTMLLTLGAAKSREVERVLLASSQLDSEFPDRLRSGFVAKYKALRAEGLDGDDLFVAMYEWAGGGGDKGREAAGLSILTHLFVICDVFEK
ncbi:hypothetical protein [Bradyrhizobium sp. USDA 3256]